jgi:hypothetical protein
MSRYFVTVIFLIWGICLVAQNPIITGQAYELQMTADDTLVIKAKYLKVNDANFPNGYEIMIHEGDAYSFNRDTVFTKNSIDENFVLNVSVLYNGLESNIFPLEINFVQPIPLTFFNMSFEEEFKKNWYLNEKNEAIVKLSYNYMVKFEGNNSMEINVLIPDSTKSIVFRTTGPKIENIKAGETYNLKFKLKSTIPGKKFKADLSADKNTFFGGEHPFEFTTSTEWLEYEIERTIPDSIIQNGFGFKMVLPRDENLIYYIDDVKVWKKQKAAEPKLIISKRSGINIYVSTDGKDENSGSLASPFKTINHALYTTEPDTIFLLPGEYYEDVRINGISRTKSNPLVISAKDKGTVLFEGIETFEYNWQVYPENPNIFQSEIPKDIWQLFVNNKMMINARWPNADHPFEDFENSNWWDRKLSWCKANHAGTGFGYEGDSLVGYVQENGEKGLASLGIDMTGKIGVLNTNSMESYAGFIYDHHAGGDSFKYKLHDDVLSSMNTHNIATVDKNASHAYFFFENGLDLLDVPGEWYYNRDTKMLYVYPENGAELSNLEVRGKTQSFAFEVSNSEFVFIQGLDFFGTTVSFVDCWNSRVEDCNFSYASYSKRMLNSIDEIDHTKMVMTQKITGDEYLSMEPTSNWFINNEVCFTDGMGFHMTRGIYDTIYNNYFHHIDISGTQGGSIGVDYRNGYFTAFIRNTFEKGGGSAATKSARFPYNSLNRLSKFGYIQDDGCAFQVAGSGQIGSITTQNWIHNTIKAGMRFDGPEDVDPLIDNKMIEGTFVRNVVWDNPLGYMVKGDYHRVYNNVAFNNSATGAKILSSAFHNNANTHSITRNNAMEDMSGDRKGDQFTHPAPGIVDHNWLANPLENTIQKVLRDPDNLDFRPKENSELVDQGMAIEPEIFPISGTQMPGYTAEFQLGDSVDIGAYEFGADEYWIPGRMQSLASTPIPPDGTETALSDADLMWLKAYKSVSNKVYFGTSPGNLSLVSEQENNIYDPGVLDPTKTYYWRVDCLCPDGWIEGDIWSFRAGGEPYKECGMPTSKVELFTTFMGLEDYDAAPWITDKDFNGEVHLFENQLLIMQNVEVNGANVWNENSLSINCNIQIREYPFMELNYFAPNRESSFTFASQVVSLGQKSKRSTAKVTLLPAQNGYTKKIINLKPMLDNWDDNYASKYNWKYLETLVVHLNPEGDWIYAEDGDFWVDDFKLGFAVIKDKLGLPEIVGQNELRTPESTPFLLTIDDLKLKVKYGNKEYPWPKCEELRSDWDLVALQGEKYSLTENIITPQNDFSGTLKVPLLIKSGENESELFVADILVGDIEVGVDDAHFQDEVQVYPNPTSGKLYLQSTIPIINLELFDIQGNKIKEVKDPESSIDISELKIGIYFINGILENGTVWGQKIIKK